MINAKNIKTKFFNNRKVAENYFFMTFLQGANILIGLLLYPYLIRTLGVEAYGIYVFIFSNIQFFNILISFGFGMPSLKKFSMNPHNTEVRSQTLSEIFTARIYLFIFCGIILAALIIFIPFVKINYLLYIIIFSTTLVMALFPNSYFQGLQKMKLATNINLATRLLTIPLIFVFIKSPSDLLFYTLIVSVLPILGAFFAFSHMMFVDKNRIRFVSFSKIKPVFSEAMPFFWTIAFGKIKQEAVTLIIGTSLDMRNVAFWDLANKIISIPRIITNSINDAIFPRVINDLPKEKVKKIIRFDNMVGISMTVIIALFGYWAVLLLGGKDMIEAYPLAVILSTTIYTSLIVGCYFNFIFVPQSQYYFATKNQFVSLLSFLMISAIGILFFKNLIFFIAAFTISHFIEIIYCRYLIKKHNLL